MIQLLLIMAAFAALPAIGRLVKAAVELYGDEDTGTRTR